jgi:hypothetical protein
MSVARLIAFAIVQAILFAGVWQWLKWIVKYMHWLGVI